MKEHKTEFCSQDSRIGILEEKIENIEDDNKEYKNSIRELNEAIHRLMKSVTSIESTISTASWILGIGLTLFGAIFSFMVIEIIKLI